MLLMPSYYNNGAYSIGDEYAELLKLNFNGCHDGMSGLFKVQLIDHIICYEWELIIQNDEIR